MPKKKKLFVFFSKLITLANKIVLFYFQSLTALIDLCLPLMTSKCSCSKFSAKFLCQKAQHTDEYQKQKKKKNILQVMAKKENIF